MTALCDDVGMLWFDNSERALAEKVLAAARYYHQKFGAWPDTCYVHPSELADQAGPATVAVKARETVRPGHFWLGQGREREGERERGREGDE